VENSYRTALIIMKGPEISISHVTYGKVSVKFTVVSDRFGIE
jgi:hypothetical protein